MKRLIILLVSSLFAFSIANADTRIGISGALTQLETSGTETRKANSTKSSKTIEEDVFVPSIFAEYVSDYGIALGVDYIPVEAELGSGTGANDDAETTGANKASAEITGHLTLYALVPMGDTFYLKAGYAMTSIDTTETLATGTAYGNETVNGYTVGVGLAQETDNGGFWRIEGTYSDYEDADFNGTLLTEASASVRNKVNAELEAVAVRFSVGKQF
tara:strand:+ start:61 stop:711 length:651 start_codon:yes stop_codon:yes gene_type:complete